MRGLIVVLALATSAAAAAAQCAFPHPAKARKIQVSLVQAYSSCYGPGDGYTTPNAVTANGIPACSPAETFRQLGAEQHGWQWNPVAGRALMQLKAVMSAPVNALDPPAGTADMALTVKIKGVMADFLPANGSGSFSAVLQLTGRDRTSGDLTQIWSSIGVAVPVVGGRAKIKTTVDTVLNAPPLDQPGLPHCANVQVVGAAINDPNHTPFASVGLLLR